MDKSEFLRHEYLTLRDEIRETKARIFKLAGLGIVGMPSAYFLGQTYKLEILVLSLPLLICTVVLLYLSESRALMRCGRYIKDRIEPEVKTGDGREFHGWEHWLEEKEKGEPNRRIVDKLVAIFFYVLFTFYYLASTSLAAQMADSKYGVVGLAVVLGCYTAVGLVFLFFLLSSFKYATTTVD